MAVPGGLLPSGYETLEDANGVTVPGGLIWTYAAGTTTPLATYTDPLLTTPNTNPIIADGSGRWIAYAAFGTGFKLVFETPAVPPLHGATIKTCDKIVAPLTELPSVDTGGVTVIIDSTATGTVNDYVLVGRTKSTLWQWLGAADLVLTGISGGASGHVLTIKNASSTANRRISLMQTNVGSAGSNQLYNAVTSAPTPIGPGGWATYVHSGGAWVLTDHCQGAALSAPYLAANYVAIGAGATWNVSAGQALILYELCGRVLTVFGNIEGSTVSGAGAGNLQILTAAWGGFVPQSGVSGTYSGSLPGGLFETGAAHVNNLGGGLDRIVFMRAGAGTWPVGSMNLYPSVRIPVV